MGHNKAGSTQAQKQQIYKYAKQSVSGGETGAAGGTPDSGGAAHTATILQAINDLKVTMEGKMRELKVDLDLIRQDLRITMHRVTEVEGRLSETEDTVKTHAENLTPESTRDKSRRCGGPGQKK
ncbi:hypothetical protein NDU88_002587 [Pleurodeles waltl]|uniref:Uncharacterized protein n=1 Tax=Pleurodeles waltl TaxID=8319 RepID=A0AAV7UA64_PLEWA|nr:hypothetical protein NDU88_002587 [Pleurodeles waltl]